MTIRYPNGKTSEGIILTRGEQTVRVAVKGSDDVCEFCNVNGTWVTEDLQPVQIEFQWQRRTPEPSTSEDDFICPQELASRLILSLLADDDEEQAEPDKPRCFAAGGAIA